VVLSEHPDSASSANDTAAEIADSGGKARVILADVRDPLTGNHLVDNALDAFGRVDVVVVNAGVLRSSMFPDVSDGDWQLHSSVHVDAAFHLVRAAWPHMASRAYGRVVMTTSAGGLYGAHGLSAYGASKMGVVGLLRVLAAEAIGTGIVINAVAPLAWTPMSQAGGRTGSTAQILGADRFATFAPEYVSEVVLLLSTPDTPADGQVFAAGGGRVAEVVIGETAGYNGPPLDWNGLREQWTTICDRTTVNYPTSMRTALAAFKNLD